MKKIAETLILCLLLSFNVSANGTNLQGLEVTGKGSITLEPDIYTFTVTLTDRKEKAKQAKQVVDEKTNQLVSVAIKTGVKQSAIETAQMHVRPIFERYNNQHNKPSDTPIKPSAIEVSRRITFTLTDFSHYDTILEQAFELDIYNISALQYQTSKADEYYQIALDAAISDANIKAKRVAKKLNIEIGDIIYMVEQSQFTPIKFVNRPQADSMSMSHRSMPGKQQIDAKVTIRFTIE